MLRCAILAVVFIFLAGPAMSQNTKGDRPVKNQRQVRETKGKSVKRKERGNTRDIAGRRLRTKGTSSANRANASYRQPPTTSRNARSQPDRSASPRGRVFSKSPRESKVRAWKGDVSGYRMRRMRPTGADAARHNVYPQKGPYVRYARKQPKVKPPVYSRTIKGKRFVEHRPRAQERAWVGGADKGPIKNQSATGTVRNTYSQRGPYVAYYKKRRGGKEKSFSNRGAVSKVQRYSRVPKTGGSQPGFYPSSASRPNVQRGRKNVYWGKYQKKERGVTTDITGGPLRTRNYKSPTAGLVGRDTLKFYGRRPGGDRPPTPQGGYPTATPRSRGWKGDVAGWPVRNPRAQRAHSNKHIRPTEPGDGAIWLAKIFNKGFRGVKPKDRVPDTRAARYSGNIHSDGSTKTFGDQGTGYRGNIKRGAGFSPGGAGYGGKARKTSRAKGGAGYSGNLRRKDLPGFSTAYFEFSGNQRRQQRQFPKRGVNYSGFMKSGQQGGYSLEGHNYSGNIKRGGRGFSGDYVGYSGNIKRGARGFSGDYVGYSGNIKRGARGFSGDYVGYSGNIKRGARGFSSDYIGYSGKMKRGDRGFSGEYVGYSGNMKRNRIPGYSRLGYNYKGNLKDRKGFSAEYAGYSGNIERIGPVKQFEVNGVNYSGFMKRGGRGFDEQGANYRGNIKVSSKAGLFGNDGADFSGTIKSKRRPKGGGSISGVLWNNNQSAIQGNPPTGADINYSGRYKAKRKEKGGGSVSGFLWNNNESPLGKNPPATAANINYTGRLKAKRPEKGGGTVSGILWNNNESALAKNPPAMMVNINYSGRTKARKPEKGGGSVSGILWNNNNEALPKSPPPNLKAVDGLQVRVKEGDYSRKLHAAKNSLPGIKPTRSSVKASEYTRVMKQYWDYKRNPNSSRLALKGIAPGKAEGRIGDFQGNLKMHKYTGRKLHPDAKFAHSEEDNVDGERSIFTNIKMFWSKMFRKNDTQPSSVKDKPKKMQYDKREKGLWAY
ncbi:MAG: hypothetical protein JNK10_03060 [Cyclobacteriaceae bacterium]|nr:hypothetical protein [Cyclobacteriaceae bacterium]